MLAAFNVVQSENNYSTDRFQPLHEFGLVWPLEVEKRAPLVGDSGELGTRTFRICLSGAGKPDWVKPVDRAPAQNLAGVHHSCRLHSGCIRAVSLSSKVKLLCVLRVDYRRGIFRV